MSSIMQSIVLVFALFAACVSGKTIIETAQSVPELSTLVSVLTSPGYEPVLNVLQGAGPFTVFAPTNNAFAAAGIDTSQVGLVSAVLKYHVLAANVTSDALKNGLQEVATLENESAYVTLGGAGQVVKVTKNFAGVQINDATATTVDVICSNGVVHIIDTVLSLPEPVSATALSAGLNIIAAAVTKAGLLDFVDNTPKLTIFVPTDAAFQAAGWENLDVATLQAVLTYHVVQGAVAFSNDLSDGQRIATVAGKDVTVRLQNGMVMINDAMVVIPNIITKNGVVHVIDRVLL